MPIRANAWHCIPAVHSSRRNGELSERGLANGLPVCETCGTPHITIVARGSYGSRDAYMVVDTGEVFDTEAGLKFKRVKPSVFNTKSMCWIILTVAHLCQRHHLCLDANIMHEMRYASLSP